jgi:hypothetical protein
MHCDKAFACCSEEQVENVPKGLLVVACARISRCISQKSCANCGDTAGDDTEASSDASGAGESRSMWDVLLATKADVTTDLGRIVDTSPITALSTVSIERVYILFRTLGLRMVPVSACI